MFWRQNSNLFTVGRHNRGRRRELQQAEMGSNKPGAKLHAIVQKLPTILLSQTRPISSGRDEIVTAMAASKVAGPFTFIYMAIACYLVFTSK